MQAAQIKLHEFLLQYETTENTKNTKIQTHTWMSNNVKHTQSGKKTVLLSIPEDKASDFYDVVFDYLKATPLKILQNRFQGENCITQKIYKDHFRLFIDLDFKEDLLGKGILSTDWNGLQAQMLYFLGHVHQTVVKAYGQEAASERILAMRLPYKFHIHYPNVITCKADATSLVVELLTTMKSDPLCAPIIQADPDIIDKSVYSTGLRLLKMHRGRMKSNPQQAQKQKEAESTYEKYFSQCPYSHIYEVVDPSTFEKKPLTIDLLKATSIHAPTEAEQTPYLLPKRSASGGEKTKAKGKLVGGMRVIDESDDTFDPTRESEASLRGVELAKAIPETQRYIVKNFNHNIREEKLMIIGNTIVVPLQTRDCLVKGQEHVGNHQYILVDVAGIRQKCHDCKKSYKHIKAGRLPMTVRNELGKLGILREVDLNKRGGKAKTHEEQLSALKDAVKNCQQYFPRNDIQNIDGGHVTYNNTGWYIKLPEAWCELCKTEHSSPCNYIQVIETGKVFLKCTLRDAQMIFDYHPDPPIMLDAITRQALFVNVNVNITQNTIINQYMENSGDVDVIFEEMPIFNDPDLNHLVFEALAATTFSVVKLFHYTANQRFNCTKEGLWYAFDSHRWKPDKIDAVNSFLSEDLCVLFRQARDYYKEHTVDFELAKRRASKINEIVNGLNNIRTKEAILREAAMYFHDHDVFYDEDEDKHFEDRLNSAKNLVGFTNGVYDLDADEFRDGSPEDCITRTVSYPFPTQSNPEKRAQIMQFLEDIQPQQAEREYMLMHLASCLHGENNQEIYHMYVGKGRNGKSKLQDLLSNTFGEYFVAVRPEMFTRQLPDGESPTAGLLNFRYKRIVMASEPKASEKFNASFIKTVTGNDTLSGRRLNSNRVVEFKPHFQLIFLTNDIPLMDATDEAIFTRSRIVNFPTKFCPNPIESHEKLINESLNNIIPEWKDEFMLILLEYYRQYKANGKKLKTPPSVIKYVNEYKMKSNPVEQFWRTNTKREEGKTTSLMGIYDAYKEWFQRNFGRSRAIDINKFEIEIERLSPGSVMRRYCHDKSSKQKGVFNRVILNTEDLHADSDESDDDTGKP